MSKTIPFFAGACLFTLLMVSCLRPTKDKQRIIATVDYSVNGTNTNKVIYDPTTIWLRPDDPDVRYWFAFGRYNLPVDSLARFYLYLNAEGLRIMYSVRSDNSFFTEGKYYYLAPCDSVVIHHPEGVIEVVSDPFFDFGCPGVRTSDCNRESSRCRFLLKENPKLSIEFDFQLKNNMDTIKAEGQIDLYYTDINHQTA